MGSSSLLLLAAISYINQLTGEVNPTEGIMIIDFGALGLQVSVYRLQYPKVLECVAHSYTQEISGDWVDSRFAEYVKQHVLEEWVKAMENEGRKDLVSGGKKAEETAEFQYVMENGVVQAVHQMLSQLGQPVEVSESVTLVPFEAEVQLSISASQVEALLQKDMLAWIQTTIDHSLSLSHSRCPDLNVKHVRVAGAASLLPLFRRLLSEHIGVDSFSLSSISISLSILFLHRTHRSCTTRCQEICRLWLWLVRNQTNLPTYRFH